MRVSIDMHQRRPPDGPCLDLVLLRHGPTVWNEEKRFQGWEDPALSDAGRARAERLAVRLAGEQLDHIYSSDLRRARETAAIVFPGRTIAVDERLRELHFGELEGHTHDECEERFGDPFRSWVRDPASHDPPGGEGLASFRERVAGWMADLPAKGHVGMVAHSGTVHLVLAEILGAPYPSVARIRISGCGISRVRRWPDGGWSVECLNDTTHLP